MGRFATTAVFYERLRPPYPAAFFQHVAETLKLSKQHALIDLGTGPGLLALGFAPYVGRITGVDPEPAMLAAAREAADRAGQELTLIAGKAEDLPDDIGRFDVVTIGRALHWMDRAAILNVLERLLAPDGALLICASSSVTDGRNVWLDSYTAARREWAQDLRETAGGRSERVHRELAAYLAGSPFRFVETISVEASHEISATDLAQRMLTYSSSSPALLGDKVEPVLRDVERRLAPFAQNGSVTEVLIATAQVVRREQI
jgi:ubiquinone/menaquinone biosynthesis C-methylase UbiE